MDTYWWFTNFRSILSIAMATFDETKEIWRRADAVCFDVDSTVSVEEAIDELAAHCGVGQEGAQW